MANRTCSWVFVLLYFTIAMLLVSSGGAGASEDHSDRQKRSSGGSKIGDMCAYNTDCQSGMYCFNGVCTCLSNYVAIAGYCWPKVNPGDSGCVENLQCEGVWPGAKCSRGGLCECPQHTLPAKTRDGTVCVTEGVPPACPLPEPNNPEAPNPATILANPTTHPLAPDTYMPVLCASSSTEVENSNGGDGSSWCIYPDGELDIYVADIYNCVPHPQVRPEYFPEYAESVDGICCHSRAFVCIQPMEPGEEPSVPRWWYNSITGTCSQFLWDSSQSENVSPNNFRTIEHCESYCRDTCRRGTAQFNKHTHGSITDETPVSNCLRQTGSCAPEFHCTLIGSQQQCCPTVGHICSPMGGRPPPYVARDPFDAGEPIAGSQSVSRFYYNTEQGRCMNFIYDGLGNYNNFLTKQECEGFCAKLVCEYGSPLRIGEDWQRCDSSADCPSSHECESAHKVCCPSAQSICTQPKRLGDCTSSVSRFFYNAGSRQCEIFQYTGCQGNDNNFDSLMDCQLKCKNIALEPKCPQGRAHRDSNGQFHLCSTKPDGAQCPPNHYCHFDGATHGCCPTKAYTCSLSADKGVQCGSGRSFRHYFNANKQTCESFQYDGCDGNANNFQSAEDCQDYCGIGGCPSGGQPLRDFSTHQLASCAEGTAACPASHECVPIHTGGSGGAAVHRCCPTKAHVCSLPPQQGNLCTKQPVTRWYFNIVTKECGRFSFNGCNGNLNNFAGAEQCASFCAAAACAAGELAARDANTKHVLHCSPALVDSCPVDYQCRYEPLTTKHVCCGTPQSDVCPAGEKAYVNVLDESVKECTINVPGSCPTNFLCRFNAAHNRYYCCASRSGNMCPDGKALYRSPRAHQATRCTMSSAQSGNACVDGFTCQSRVPNVVQGYCCSAQPVCKNGGDFLVDESTQMPRICMHGSYSACDEGYRCYKAHANGVGYCCKGDSPIVASGCPPGEFAMVTKTKMGREEVVQCDPFNLPDKGCAAKFTCQYAVAFQRYQCCGREPVEEEEEVNYEYGCPAGQAAYVQGGSLTPQLCTSSAPSICPVGFSCQFSEPNRQFQCCAHKAGCPADTVAYVDMEGNAQVCRMELPTRTQCPLGYSCRTAGERNICCTLEGVDRFTTAHPQNTFTATTVGPAVAIFSTTPAATTGHSTGEIEKVGELGEDHSVVTDPPTTVTVTTPVSIEGRPDGTVNAGGVAKRCRPNEFLIEGRCVERLIGEGCITHRHCPDTSQCVEYHCQCPDEDMMVRENRCVEEEGGGDEEQGNGDASAAPAPTKPEPAVGKGKGTGRAQRPMAPLLPSKGSSATTTVPTTTVTTRPLVCPPHEIAYKGRCLRRALPLGATCLISLQCMPGAQCTTDSKCHCPSGQVGHNNKCHSHVCGSDKFRLPQLSASRTVVKCGGAGGTHPPSSSQCEFPNRCTFSRQLHDYICCRAASAATAIVRGIVSTGTVRGGGATTTTPAVGATNSTTPSGAGQPTGVGGWGSGKGSSGARRATTSLATAVLRGSGSGSGKKVKKASKNRCLDGTRPLLFPGTQYPLKCVSVVSCPKGYSCIRNMCCNKKLRPTSTALAIAAAKRRANKNSTTSTMGKPASHPHPHHYAFPTRSAPSQFLPPGRANLPGISRWTVYSASSGGGSNSANESYYSTAFYYHPDRWIEQGAWSIVAGRQ